VLLFLWVKVYGQVRYNEYDCYEHNLTTDRGIPELDTCSINFSTTRIPVLHFIELGVLDTVVLLLTAFEVMWEGSGSVDSVTCLRQLYVFGNLFNILIGKVWCTVLIEILP